MRQSKYPRELVLKIREAHASGASYSDLMRDFPGVPKGSFHSLISKRKLTRTYKKRRKARAEESAFTLRQPKKQHSDKDASALLDLLADLVTDRVTERVLQRAFRS